MAQMDAIHFCRFKSNSPGKLIDTVIILFVLELMSRVTHRQEAMTSCQLRRGGVCSIAASAPSLQRGRCLLAY